MHPLAYRLFHASSFLTGLTGVAYGVFLYAWTPADEFAVVNHPAQPHAQHAHILLGVGPTLMVGYFAGLHGLPYAASATRKGRRSGLSMLWTALPMIFSGFALQVSVEPAWRTAWTAVHIATSLAWMAGHFIHFRIHHKDREAAERRES